MPTSLKMLRHYRYDPLDYLLATGSAGQAVTQYFYRGTHLVTQLDENTHRSIFRYMDRSLAQQQGAAGPITTTIFATDRADSLMQTLGTDNARQMAYTAYGHHCDHAELSRLAGFNGERPDALTGHYLLGLGKRAFNPVLMRFNSPDELSPWGAGGLNAYSYCECDPVNFTDPTGNAKFNVFLKGRVLAASPVEPVLPPISVAPIPVEPFRENSVRASVIIDNPQSRASVIINPQYRPPRPRATPLPYRLKDASPQIRTKIFSAENFPHELTTNRDYKFLSDKPGHATQQLRAQLPMIETYDSISRQPDFKTIATPKMRKSWESIEHDLLGATGRRRQNLYTRQLRLKRLIKVISVYKYAEDVRNAP